MEEQRNYEKHEQNKRAKSPVIMSRKKKMALLNMQSSSIIPNTLDSNANSKVLRYLN